jgi:hypothetical protein
MQCREVRDLLDSFLSQELLVETNHELMRHLETCPDCRAELEARRQLRTMLQRAFTNTDALQPRTTFAAEAMAQVGSTQTRRATRSNVRTWGYLALAASALLVTAAGLFIFGNRVAAVVRDAAGDHRNCALQFRLAERPISLADAAARYDPLYARLQDTPPNEMMTAAGPVRVVDRHSCVFAGRRFGHVVLQIEGQLVSLLVTADEGRSETRPSPGNAVSLSWLPTVDGQRLASFRTPGHVTFIVSAIEDRPFREIAQALADPVSRRLAILLRNMPDGVGVITTDGGRSLFLEQKVADRMRSSFCDAGRTSILFAISSTPATRLIAVLASALRVAR